MHTLDPLKTFRLPSKDFGEVRVSPIPIIDGHWGVLEPLRNTDLGRLIPIIPGKIMAEARHGWVRPLMQIIGRPPEAMLRVIPATSRICADNRKCGAFRLKDCQPVISMPDCYIPPDLPEGAQTAGNSLLLSWRNGVYVLLVDGPEFSL